MEMCYDGAIVLPSSYAVMNEDEMTYVEGGGVRAWVLAGIGSTMGFLFGITVDNSVWCKILGCSLAAPLDAFVSSAIATFWWNPALSAEFVVLATGCALGIGSALGLW